MVGLDLISGTLDAICPARKECPPAPECPVLSCPTAPPCPPSPVCPVCPVLHCPPAPECSTPYKMPFLGLSGLLILFLLVRFIIRIHKKIKKA